MWLYTLITLPTDFVASLKGYVGEVFTDVSPLVAIAIGLPLAFWVGKALIGLVRFRTGRR